MAKKRALNSRLAAAAFAAVLTLCGGAFAQELPPPPGGPAASPQAQAEHEVLSETEMVTRSSDYVGKMKLALKSVLDKLEDARNSKDVVKLNCVNEKLTNIKGLLRISEQADIALQEAVAKKEEQGAQHEYSKVTIAFNRVSQLQAEAEQCVGMLAFETGKTITVVEIPEDLPSTDPTQSPPAAPVVSRPPPASPIN